MFLLKNIYYRGVTRVIKVKKPQDKLLWFEGYGAVRHRPHHSQRLNAYALRTQLVAPVLKSLFYRYGAPCKLCAGGLYNIFKTFYRVTAGEKIVHDKHVVIFIKIFLCDNSIMDG